MPMPFKNRKDLGFERMFETRSDAWEAVGLALETNERSVKRAQKRSLAILPLIAAVLVAYDQRHRILGEHGKAIKHGGKVVGYHASGPPWSSSPWDTPLQIGAVIVFIALGWALARSVGKAAGPTLMKRMDPGTAGTVGFLIRLVTVLLTVLVALKLAGVNTASLAIGASFTAVIFGLAAQQTLGNLIAGMVLLSARPFKVGERIRLQAGAVGGSAEGIVSSLGLLYTTLARGDDRILIPNNVVLGAAVVPLKEPDSVDVRVRLGKTIRPGQLQEILDDRIATPTRNGAASVLLEEIDGDEVVVRVQATPERAVDGARLADEIITVLTSVTAGHDAVTEQFDGVGQRGLSGSDDARVMPSGTGNGVRDGPREGREADAVDGARQGAAGPVGRERGWVAAPPGG
jgi:small-conductance mechanosensitive channel